MEIDPANRPAATLDAATYYPTFAYEAAWDLGAAAGIVWAERRLRLDRGRVFALYVAAGRGWIEMLRVDPANHVIGLRLNVWTSLLLFVAAVAFLVLRRLQQLTTPAPALLSGAVIADGTVGQAAAAVGDLQAAPSAGRHRPDPDAEQAPSTGERPDSHSPQRTAETACRER